MPISFERLDMASARVFGLRLSGAVAQRDQRVFAEFAAGLEADGVRGLVLDMSEMGSISEGLAGEMAALQRRLLDLGGEMVFVGANVAVGWFLDRRFGPLSHRMLSSVAAAESALAPQDPPAGEDAMSEGMAEDPVDQAPRRTAGNGWSTDVNEAGRPDRFSFAALMHCLRGSSDPVGWLEPLRAMLKRTGLGGDLKMCRRVGDEMKLVGRDDYGFPADGWLGSLLAGADCALGIREIGGDGLTMRELGFLRWCDGDVVIPVVAPAGELTGALFIESAREGGLYGYRSGELLALSLLGRVLAMHLPYPGEIEVAADATNESETDALIMAALERETLTV